MESMKCPDCGAPLHFEEEQEYCFCSHCGAQVYKKDVNKQSFTYREINDAKIREMEFKEKELEYKERAQKRRIILVLIAVIIVIAIIAFVYFNHGTDGLWGLGAAVMFGGMLIAWIIDVINDKK